ncbi:biotin--[acetyl-CoA-carboxylase] ligase [Olsenella sp. DSM 107455]|uniref:Biotin--[acetyl-CoA-carboxylase] ligase n=1 Tax=Thermophilibacter gallinarum TaxID=2779357 RepID=A0ABR9QQT6_9ACTN|nr:biotin--[acetyl-CoA-carboxylase] ligase [Thermophilibacter gallinarum]MBE5023429.1 biotin--[acetyl-CoA-carboxylase] ligase [Thermophilibacter gallinarum]
MGNVNMLRDGPTPDEQVGMTAKQLLTVLEETGSTNDDALGLGRAGAPHGTAVAARRQTAGRGRRGHVWESPAGNLYLSVVLRPAVAPTRLPGLAAVCGLGAADVLREARLKWPNDLLARGRKLAGALVEAARDDAGDTFAVCGIGVNVVSAPRDLGAISLAELGEAPSFSPLAKSLRDAVVGRVDAWAAAGGDRPLDGVRDDYLSRLAWLGEKVRVLAAEDGSELARGTFETVDPWGRAVVDGIAYAAEQASLRPLDPVPPTSLPIQPSGPSFRVCTQLNN